MLENHDNSAPGYLAGYLALGAKGLRERAALARELIKGCRLCPRQCGVDRTSGELGYCGIGDRPFVSSYGPHFGEEPPLVGLRGSGTIFLGGCNMGCVYCQNWTISHGVEGSEISEEALARIMLGLQASGCHNINLVTPTHQVPMILGALALAVPEGLCLPLVYNCGGYESLEALRLMDGVVDIYMPDLKYMDQKVADRLSEAPGYVQAAKEAILEMHRQVGDLLTDDSGIAIRGLIVRHLVLPGGLSGAGEAMEFLAREVSLETYVNLMDQYRPCYRADQYPEINHRPTAGEFRDAVEKAKKAGLKRLAGVTDRGAG